MNVRQLCEGGVRRFGSRRETVRSATSMPSFRSSPWIRGAPQSGFAAAICVTRALIWALTGGRPTAGRPESFVQYSRKRCRCHRRTVSGVTMARGCLHPAQTLASPTQKNRSAVRSLGRVIVLLYTASCWCKARFSRELAVAAAEEREEAKQGEQEGDHRAGIFPGSNLTVHPLPPRRSF